MPRARPIMEAAALTTYTAAMQDEPEAIGPGAEPQAAIPELVPSPVSATLAPPAPDAIPEKTFRDFGIAEPICAALEAEGITTAFPIQALTLPDRAGRPRPDRPGPDRHRQDAGLRRADPAAAGRHARRREGASPRALVVVPTRELAFQVAQDLEMAGSRMGAQRRRAVRRPGLRAPDRGPGQRSTSSSGRPAGCWTWSGRATCTWARCTRSSWTRPTRCWTSASCRTWRRSSA